MIDKLFIKCPTKALFEQKLAANEIKNTSIVFIEDSDLIWTQGQYYGTTSIDPESIDTPEELDNLLK